MRRPTVFLLLLVTVLGLSAGPHPCHRMEGPAKAVSEHASCHGGESASKTPSRQGHDCCDPLKGGHALCDQACQGAAVLSVAAGLPAVRSFGELTAVLPDRPASSFVAKIDHVPLG